MKELEEMKKCFDEFIAKAEQTLVRMKGKQEILTKEEKEYLEAVIRPFKDEVAYIKLKIEDTIYTTDRVFIFIVLKHFNSLQMPYFKCGTMYKGMELEKEYTLEELGLFKGEEV